MPVHQTGTEVDLRTEQLAHWCPFHFAGWFEGEDQRANYPQGTDPIVLGESVNTLTTYGFDPVTGMQEPKATLCQVRAA
jgi:formate dehydrogenase major subunit